MIKVCVDSRETRADIIDHLEKLGAKVTVKTLEVGDYVLSDRVCVERKTTDDFLNSFIDNKNHLFSQIADMSRSYERPLLLIEGSPLDLYVTRNVHPNAIRGMLASIAVGFGVPITYTISAEDTAQFLYIAARREQEDHKRTISLHGKRSHMTLDEQRVYCISSISDIGPVLATNLLEHFGTVEKVMTASIDELTQVEKIGKKTAERIRDIVNGQYNSS
ncbi:MAG: helix-hairpin-helix domain-containing protein [Candidatus Syntrophoarchaeum sp.]|nr:helix-hairpin-helix domain-containing protein [Candidatus Syntrophoarchaeum sp.]